MSTSPDNIKDLAEDAYEFGRELDVMQGGSFEDFWKEVEPQNIPLRANEIRQKWPQTRKMWETRGVEKSLIDQWERDTENYEKRQLGKIIIEKAEAQKKSFFVDWRWSPEDLIWNVEQLIPKLQIIFLSEKLDEEKEIYEVVVEYNGEKETLEVKLANPFSLIDFINGKLQNDFKEYVFVEYYTKGDSYGFLLIRKSIVEKYIGNEFIPYRYSPASPPYN